MKVLILAEHYVKDRNYSLLYVHTRNLEYVKAGLDVIVLNFKETDQYKVDGLKVYGEKKLLENFRLSDFDVVISHAPNLKNHFRFLLKNRSHLKRLIFFIHGHEVLLKDKYYPKPFDYQKQLFISTLIHFFYDRIKVHLFSFFLKYLISTVATQVVFVSQWMKEEFYKCINIDPRLIEDKSFIIHNPVNQIFINKQYTPQEPFVGDFVTIRPFDGPKYCVDLVWKLAKDNPQYKFTLYGEGEFFKHYPAPKNLDIIEGFLKHNEIPEVLNKHRAALMLTRLDAQGVMACEMAVYGIPLVTSDIPLKRGLLEDGQNVAFIPNDLSVELKNLKIQTGDHSKLIHKFSNASTLGKELALIKKS